MSLPSLRGRDLPPADEALEAYADKYDVSANWRELAKDMAEAAADAGSLPVRYQGRLEIALEAFLAVHVDSEDRLAMLFENKRVPSLEDFIDPGDPHEGDRDE